MSTREDAARQSLERQAKVLSAIEAYIRQRNRPPTLREIARDADVRSLSHLTFLLEALERRGLITWERGVSRGPVPKWMGASVRGVPILGRIAAGAPLDLFEPEGPPGTLDLEAHAQSGEDAEYALLVRGDSMIEDGILDGDYVLVRPGLTANDGAIVVAVHLLAEGSERGAATLKRLKMDQKHERVLLRPANAALQPIEITAAEWEREWVVQGTVTAIYRPYSQAQAPQHRTQTRTPARQML